MRTAFCLLAVAPLIIWYLFINDPHIDWRIKVMDFGGRIIFYKCGLNPEMKDYSRKCVQILEIQEKAKEQNGIRSNDFFIPSATHLNETLPARLFSPTTTSQNKRALIVHFHGGGYSLGSGSNTLYDEVLRWISESTDSYVLTVDYRLAPEYGFPACIQDTYSTLAYINDLFVAGDDLFKHVDVNKIVTIGDSAGATLVFSASYIVRDQIYPVISQKGDIDFVPLPKPLTIKIAHQILVYPNANEDTASKLNDKAYLLNSNIRHFFYNAYLGKVARDDKSYYKNQFIYPLRSKSLLNLPTSTVITATFDPLRDDGILMAEKYKEAGIKVYHKEYETVHGFLFFPFLKEAKQGVEYIASVLKQEQITNQHI